MYYCSVNQRKDRFQWEVHGEHRLQSSKFQICRLAALPHLEVIYIGPFHFKQPCPVAYHHRYSSTHGELLCSCCYLVAKS